MKKLVMIYDRPSEGSLVEFRKAEAVACPFCRREELWWDTVSSLPEMNETAREVSVTSYICGSCGATFWLTHIDPDLKRAVGRANLERFRTAPVICD